MTLHWWMHWFWVTTLLGILLSSGSYAAPQSQPQKTTEDDAVTEHNSERQGRAMYFTKTTLVPTTTKISAVNISRVNDSLTDQKNITLNLNKTEILNVTSEIVHPSFVIPEISNISVTESKNDYVNESVAPTISNATEVQNATVAPNKKRNNLTRHPEIKEVDASIEGAAESRIVTEKPLSLETTFLQTRIPANIESSRRIIDHPDDSGMDTGEIAGISFAALVLVALAGSTAFVLYRRRYLNKPQTLNDKCSNPDSSGYLDDSTIRDNSEEMYSLDNDSFLNSLEAMTIQNYWTDTVKHTKL